MVTQKELTQINWVIKGTEFARECKKLCEAERFQISSKMSETMAAFAERTIRSLKNIYHRSMEHYGYKYNHKVSNFVITLNSSKT